MADERTDALSVERAKDRLLGLGRAFDRQVGASVRRRAWLWLGGSFLLGLAASGRVGGRSRRRYTCRCCSARA